MDKTCIFCKIVAGKIKIDKIYENDNFISFPDANPAVEGHSLVIPKKHFKTFLDLPNTLGTEFLDCVKKTTLILMEKHKAEGFNLVSNNFPAAGQEVHHFHLHIIPRKEKDGRLLHLMKK